MASIHSTLTDAGEPGPPHVVRFRWKPELDGELRAGRETFKRIDTARRWVRDFDEARETGGWPGVREFVLAWRARDAEPDEEPEEPTLAEFMEDWLRRDAVPNLAPNTIASYLPAYNNHIRALPVDPKDPKGQVFGELPLSEFAEPHIHNEFRESLKLTGRSKSNQQAAKKVLSSALSWGVESRAYRRWLPTNGAKLVTGRRRRSNRARAATSAEVRLPRSRVFNAFDYELVRAAAARAHRAAHLGAAPRRRDARPAVRLRLAPRGGARRALVAGALAHREARPACCACARWSPPARSRRARPVGSLRDAILPAVIAERLREWRELAAAHALPTGPQDFIIPGRAPRRAAGPRRAHDPKPGEALGRQVPAPGLPGGRAGRRGARLPGRRHPVRRTARAHQLPPGGGRERPGGGRELRHVAQDDHRPLPRGPRRRVRAALPAVRGAASRARRSGAHLGPSSAGDRDAALQGR